MLFDCHVSHFIWRTIHVAFGLRPPHSVAHLFGNWLQGIDKKTRFQVWVGAISVYWSICLSRNDIIFDKKGIILICKLSSKLHIVSILVPITENRSKKQLLHNIEEQLFYSTSKN